MPDQTLIIRDLTKVFDTDTGPVTAVRDVNLTIEEDEFFSLLGPSGCGKTTTLRMIAGLETITSGTIEFSGRDIAARTAAERNIGMVFQSYALFPHMTVLENAAYGLRVRKESTQQLTPKVEALLATLGLEGLSTRYPSDLSGGQQQRVSIARALAYDPDMFLLDEPLANLDAKLRVAMREEIRRIQKELGVLALYVTHDQEEAMSVSDRIGVFNLGRLMQVGTPPEIYRTPSSLFVADFIGKVNFFPAESRAGDARGARVRLADGLELDLHRIETLSDEEKATFGITTDAVVAVRPEHLRIEPDGAEGVPGVLRRVLFLGSIVRSFVQCADALREVVVESSRLDQRLVEGAPVRLSFDRDDAICFRRAVA
jgi:iron(III) transport system ATP-binding protein